jgi:hypothetical protein
MKFSEDPNKECFTEKQNDLLREGLRRYKANVATATRGGTRSWFSVAADIEASEAYEAIFVELIKADKRDLPYGEATGELNITPADQDKAGDRWQIIGKNLGRFVDGEQSRDTGKRRYITPAMWVRRVIYEFLLAQGLLPLYFDEKDPENFFAAVALLRYFETGVDDSAFQRHSFTGTYQARKKGYGDFCLEKLRFTQFPNHCFYTVLGWSLHQPEAAPEDHDVAGWAIMPPGGGLLVFLKVREGEDSLHRVYVTHSIQVQHGHVQEFVLGAYEAQSSSQLSHSHKKHHAESLFFINRMPISFDRTQKIVKTFRPRTMRGEAAPALDYDEQDDRETRMPKRSIDLEFLCAVCEDNARKVERLIDSVTDINIRVGGTEGTALHVIARYQLKDVFKVLRRRQDLNYLAKDKKGRLPSSAAMEAGDDVGLGMYLLRKELQQARREGIDYRAWAIDNVLRPQP